MLPIELSRVLVKQIRKGWGSYAFDTTYPSQIVNHTSPQEYQDSVGRINASFNATPIASAVSTGLDVAVWGSLAIMCYTAFISWNPQVYMASALTFWSVCFVSIPAKIYVNYKRNASVTNAIYAEHSRYMSRVPQSAWNLQLNNTFRPVLCIDLMSVVPNPGAFANAGPVGFAPINSNPNPNPQYVNNPPAYHPSAPELPFIPVGAAYPVIQHQPVRTLGNAVYYQV